MSIIQNKKCLISQVWLAFIEKDDTIIKTLLYQPYECAAEGERKGWWPMLGEYSPLMANQCQPFQPFANVGPTSAF